MIDAFYFKKRVYLDDFLSCWLILWNKNKCVLTRSFESLFDKSKIAESGKYKNKECHSNCLESVFLIKGGSFMKTVKWGLVGAGRMGAFHGEPLLHLWHT